MTEIDPDWLSFDPGFWSHKTNSISGEAVHIELCIREDSLTATNN